MKPTTRKGPKHRVPRIRRITDRNTKVAAKTYSESHRCHAGPAPQAKAPDLERYQANPVGDEMVGYRSLLVAMLVDAFACLSPPLKNVDSSAMQQEVLNFDQAVDFFTREPDPTDQRFDLDDVCAYLSLGNQSIAPDALRPVAREIAQHHRDQVEEARAELVRRRRWPPLALAD